MSKTDYRFVGKHPDNLDDGRTVAPLDKVSLGADEAKLPHAARMLADGLLIEITKPTPAGAKEEK